MRIGFVRELEREHDVLRSDAAEPEVVAQTGPIVGDHFVDDVPLADSVSKMADHGMDVIAHDRDELITAEGPRGEPGGILAVPHQRVAANAHPVGRGEGDRLVGAGEVVPALLRMDLGPLHGVLGRHARVLARRDDEVLRIRRQLGQADRGSDQPVPYLPKTTQGLLAVVGGGRFREGQAAERDGHRGDGDHHPAGAGPDLVVGWVSHRRNRTGPIRSDPRVAPLSSG